MLPKGSGFGSGVTCWRRLRDWQKAGVWRRLHRVLLDEPGKAGLIDWSRVSLDPASVPAKRGGAGTGPNPPDRGRPGSKRHAVTDARGVPLTVALTDAHVHDSKVFGGLIGSIVPVRGVHVAGHAGGPKSSTPIKATITRVAGGSCESGASGRG
jgi:transposase